MAGSEAFRYVVRICFVKTFVDVGKDFFDFIKGHGAGDPVGLLQVQTKALERIGPEQLFVFQITEKGAQAGHFAFDGFDGIPFDQRFQVKLKGLTGKNFQPGDFFAGSQEELPKMGQIKLVGPDGGGRELFLVGTVV